MELARTAIKWVDVPVTATNAIDGSPATVTGFDFCLVAPAAGTPDESATWTPGSFDSPSTTGTILLVGPRTTSGTTPHILVSDVGGDLYGRVVSGVETDVALIDHVWIV